MGHAGLVATRVDEVESLLVSSAFLMDLGESKDTSTVSPDQRDGGLPERLVCCWEEALVVLFEDAWVRWWGKM